LTQRFKSLECAFLETPEAVKNGLKRFVKIVSKSSWRPICFE